MEDIQAFLYSDKQFQTKQILTLFMILPGVGFLQRNKGYTCKYFTLKWIDFTLVDISISTYLTSSGRWSSYSLNNK